MVDDMGRKIKSTQRMSGPRRIIGQRMGQSLREIPQMSGSVYMNIANVFELKDKLQEENPAVSTTAVFVRLLAEALTEYPLMNSALFDDELTIYESVNIAVGVGLKSGIVTVVIRDAQEKDVFQISEELREMLDKLNKGTLAIADMQGSTITISNVGNMGFESFTPVINPPETAILGIGGSRNSPYFKEDGSVGIEQQTCFSMTSNHAVVDGYHTGQFFNVFGEKLKNAEKYMKP